MAFPRYSPSATHFKGKYVECCETQSSASLCELKMQKMRVDCCFLLSKTRWGKLGQKEGGVMYLDLTFHQPAKCKLSHATITMDFHEIPDPIVPRPALAQKPSDLEVTEFFGPQSLTAEKRERLVSTTVEANPTVGVAGATFQGLRFARSSVVSYASRWQFEGSRFAPDYSPGGTNSRDSRYRRVVWHLQENELDKQAVHQNTVHCALAFTHQSKPFYLDVKIEARLQRWHDRLKQKLVSPPRNRRTSARATIQTSIRNNIDPDFAKLARDLDKSMTEANLHPITGELSLLYLAVFQELMSMLDRKYNSQRSNQQSRRLVPKIGYSWSLR
ncbi:hypothetical protein F1880_001750 [Penicillium rolfsii]|nr:hypothetical protein F1880_001750 [Penicillium rolfsii]